MFVEPSAHGGHVFAVPVQLFGALTFPPPDFVQFPVQFRFVLLLDPHDPPQDVPISPQDAVPHFLTEALLVQEVTHEFVVLKEPHLFVDTQAWLETLLLVQEPEHALV